MTHDFVMTLREEIKALEDELSSDPRFRKLQALRAALAMYEAPQQRTGAMQASAAGPKREARRQSDDRVQALEIAASLLEGKSEPVPTRVLFDAVSAEGHVIGGREPISNLSAMLSRDERFQAVGRRGWLLALPRVVPDGEAGITDPSSTPPAQGAEDYDNDR